MEFDHFLSAQNPVYEQVLRELAAGRKQSHWMWFIFPQLKGLGFSATSQRFALDSVDAATRYLQHNVLGPRLRECTQLVLNVRNKTAEEIFGYRDWMKTITFSFWFFSAARKCSQPIQVRSEQILI